MSAWRGVLGAAVAVLAFTASTHQQATGVLSGGAAQEADRDAGRGLLTLTERARCAALALRAREAWIALYPEDAALVDEPEDHDSDSGPALPCEVQLTEDGLLSCLVFRWDAPSGNDDALVLCFDRTTGQLRGSAQLSIDPDAERPMPVFIRATDGALTAFSFRSLASGTGLRLSVWCLWSVPAPGDPVGPAQPRQLYAGLHSGYADARAMSAVVDGLFHEWALSDRSGERLRVVPELEYEARALGSDLLIVQRGRVRLCRSEESDSSDAATAEVQAYLRVRRQAGMVEPLF